MYAHTLLGVQGSLFLHSSAGGTEALDSTRRTSATSASQSTQRPALISSLNILTLFKLHHKFMLLTASTHSSRREHHCESVFAHENQSVLSSPRSYTKQSLDCMPWRVCAADVREKKTKERKDWGLQHHTSGSGQSLPTGKLVSENTESHATSTRDRAGRVPLLQTPHTTSQTSSFSWCEFTLCFIKKWGDPRLEPERQILPAHLSLPVSITGDAATPGGQQSIIFSFWRRVSHGLQHN